MSSFPYPGITIAHTQNNATVLRLAHEADPQKGLGEKTWVEAEQMWMSPWLLAEYRRMSDKSLFRQELLVDGAATLGSLIYQMQPEATLEESFPIPAEWTRYMALDPHPAVPHSALWGAVDPWGDVHLYRELWPSKVCYHYEDGKLVGKPGPGPAEDNRYTIRDFVAALRWLESDDNPENEYQGKRFTEKIYKRVIDYAARSFGKGTADDPEQPNYQQRFESHMRGTCECGCPPLDNDRFEDAKKDHAAGREMVNEWLKPREVDDGRHGWTRRSKLRIFADRCPELVYQLKNHRQALLTPEQASRMDPTGKAVAVRCHGCDNLRYLVMARPEFVRETAAAGDWKPLVPGLSY